MCNCITRISKDLNEHLIKNGDGKQMLEPGHFKCVGWALKTEGSWWQTGQVFQYKITPIKKNGSEGRQITKSVDVKHTFCPFCGEKYPE